MSSDLNEMRSRNARLRNKIEKILKGSDRSVHDAVRDVALELRTVERDDMADSLQDVHDNLRKRADALISAGVAKSNDFEGTH
jgi:hypothetical protein